MPQTSNIKKKKYLVYLNQLLQSLKSKKNLITNVTINKWVLCVSQWYTVYSTLIVTQNILAV